MKTYQVVYQVDRTRRALIKADSPEAAEAFVIDGNYDIGDDEVIDGNCVIISYAEVDLIPWGRTVHIADDGVTA